MPEYRRSKVEGGTYFFTLVTYNRNPILTHPTSREILHDIWLFVQARRPFRTDAICLLPNHLHCIWTLPEGDADFSTRWKEIKRLFTHRYLNEIDIRESISDSRLKRKEAAIWQRRFWEHTIRDEADLENHLNYIHFNPVKHGLVTRPGDWEWSSFHRYVKMGTYGQEWEDKGDQIPLGMSMEFE